MQQVAKSTAAATPIPRRCYPLLARKCGFANPVDFNTAWLKRKMPLGWRDKKIAEYAENGRLGNPALTKTGDELTSIGRSEPRYFGANVFGGAYDVDHETQLTELKRPPRVVESRDLEFAKYPGIASGLGPEFYFRDRQKHPMSFFHLKTEKRDVTFVGSTHEFAREHPRIEKHVKNLDRGHAVQMIMDGRGAKIYYEPGPPELKARLGVGSKVICLKEEVLVDPDVTITVNKKGTLAVVHGPTQARVGMVAYRLFKKCEKNVYTMKGAHLAMHPIKQKDGKSSKKK